MNRLKTTAIAMAIAGLMSGAQLASADEGADLYASKGCAACHGADANTPIMPTYPKLAGQNAEYALQQMKDIKSGARANGLSAAMKGVVAAVSDDDLEKIAKWLASK